MKQIDQNKHTDQGTDALVHGGQWGKAEITADGLAVNDEESDALMEWLTQQWASYEFTEMIGKWGASNKENISSNINHITNDELCMLLLYDTCNQRTAFSQVIDCLIWMLLKRLQSKSSVSLGQLLWEGPTVLRKSFCNRFSASIAGEMMLDEYEQMSRRAMARWILESGGSEHVILSVSHDIKIRTCRLVVLFISDAGQRHGWCMAQKVLCDLWGVSNQKSAALVEIVKDGVW
ncbi:hypothetical protein [Poriferisphaera sp. WC338]|uniref:hypothetical protein n=1 Tax=Poriferisphaera sp. WC338 TaxID=3425129 RepID=UPI003D817158